MEIITLINRLCSAISKALKKGRENDIKKDPLNAFDNSFSGMRDNKKPVSTPGDKQSPE